MIARQSNTTEKKGIHVLFLNFETKLIIFYTLFFLSTSNSPRHKQLTMHDINFNILKDRAMDVDPDIRFMALEDLRKFLQDESAALTRTTLNQSLENFFPILLNMLNDQNPDVQTQAIKSFEPMVKYLSNETFSKLVKKLFALVQQNSSSTGNVTGLKSFTVSVPNIALRSLFAQSNSRDKSEFVSDKLSNSNYRFDPHLARYIMDYLIPQIVGNPVTIDSIELLIDLVTEIGYVLTQDELLNLSLYLTKVALTETGLIGKKSMVALERVVALVRTEVVIDKLLAQINQLIEPTKLFVIFQLYSVCLKRGIKPNSIDTIYNTITSNLNIEATEEEDDDDLDFDNLVKENSLKDEALTTLIDLVSQHFLPVESKNTVIALIKSYVNYNPLAQDEDFIDDEEDDISFSDDEQEDDGDGENDGSWKLRAKATILTRALLKSFPDTLELFSKEVLPVFSFADSNDQVVSEVIKSSIAIVNSTSPRDSTNVSELFPIIAARMKLAKETQVPLFLKLVESLNRFDKTSLVLEVFEIIKDRKLITSGSFDYLQFYSSTLKFHDNLPPLVIERMSSDFIKNLDDKSFNMITDSIKCLSLLFHQDSLEKLDAIVDLLIYKVENSKQYPSDLVRQSIIALGEAYGRADKQKILNVFKHSIEYEGTSKTTIDVLTQIYSTDIPSEYSYLILKKLSTSIMSSTEATSVASLLLMNKIFERLPSGDYDDAAGNLVQLLAVTNKANYECIFHILIKLVGTVLQETHRAPLLQTIVKLVNEGKIEVADNSFFQFITTACNQIPDLYNFFEDGLNLNSELSAKILAICASQNKLENKIMERREEFQNYYNSNINDSRLAFDILFLGYVGTHIEVKELDVQTLIGLLSNSQLTNDDNILAASTALGLIAQKHIDSAVPIILNAYESSEKTIIRGSLVDSLSIAADACNEDQKRVIWDKVFNFPVEFDHEVITELKKSGELLGKIPVVDELTINTDNLKTTYLILVITKSLLNNLQATKVNNTLLDSLIKSSIEWLNIVNIDIRQIVVGNLLTGLHSKPDTILPILDLIILPKIFDQLQAEDSFKKIITMGPYKYVLDEGLEIRKLCYEFIYSVISLENAVIKKYNINLEKIASKIIEVGLIDTQTDITVLACINLTNYIELHKDSAVELITRDGGNAFTTMINNLKKQLSKKLSAKASTQDSESHQERIKSIIKLSKKFANVVEAAESIELAAAIRVWNEYNNDLKTNFTIYYNSTDGV